MNGECIWCYDCILKNALNIMNYFTAKTGTVSLHHELASISLSLSPSVWNHELASISLSLSPLVWNIVHLTYTSYTGASMCSPGTVFGPKAPRLSRRPQALGLRRGWRVARAAGGRSRSLAASWSATRSPQTKLCSKPVGRSRCRTNRRSPTVAHGSTVTPCHRAPSTRRPTIIIPRGRRTMMVQPLFVGRLTW